MAGESIETKTIGAIIDALKQNSERLKGIHGAEEFKQFSSALSDFAAIDWVKVTQGVNSFKGLGKAFEGASGSVRGFSTSIRGIDQYSKSFESLNKLLDVFKAFSLIRWKDVFYGMAGLRTASMLFPSLGRAMLKLKSAIGSKDIKETIESFAKFVHALDTFGRIPWTRVIIGITTLKVFSGAFELMSKQSRILKSGADTFASVAKTIGAGVGGFFKAIPFSAVAKGVLILGGLAVSLGLLAGSFFLFSKVSWDDVENGLKALIAFGAVTAGLGLAIELLVPGLIALAGIGVALLVFGASLMVVGKGMQFLADGMNAVMATVTTMADDLERLIAMSAGILATAGALGVLSAAIVAFTAATAAGGIVGAVGGAVTKAIDFLTGSDSKNPIDQLARLAAMSDPLERTASALERINRAIMNMPSTAGIDLSKFSNEKAALASARDAAVSRNSSVGSIGSTIKTATQAVSTRVSSVVVNNSFMPDRSTALILAPAI